jgi:hypothetical protein
MEERKNVSIILIVSFCGFLFLFFTLNGCNQDIADITRSTPDSEKQILS